MNTKIFLVVIFVLHLAVCIQNPEKKHKQISQKLESGFVNPPDSIQTSVYWYWISDNISKEGAVKDLHAMKDAGINRAFIGNIGIDGLPYGEVKMFSDEWWEILHLALKTATELDIEIGIFNSPGWSQSGGPWIKPEELGDIENRTAISAGHIYGKTKISAESNTSGDPAYSRYPAMMKQRTDRFFAEGINNTLLHVYIMQPYEDKNPGVNAYLRHFMTGQPLPMIG